MKSLLLQHLPTRHKQALKWNSITGSMQIVVMSVRRDTLLSLVTYPHMVAMPHWFRAQKRPAVNSEYAQVLILSIHILIITQANAGYRMHQS